MLTFWACRMFEMLLSYMFVHETIVMIKQNMAKYFLFDFSWTIVKNIKSYSLSRVFRHIIALLYRSLSAESRESIGVRPLDAERRSFTAPFRHTTMHLHQLLKLGYYFPIISMPPTRMLLDLILQILQVDYFQRNVPTLPNHTHCICYLLYCCE